MKRLIFLVLAAAIVLVGCAYNAPDTLEGKETDASEKAEKVSSEPTASPTAAPIPSQAEPLSPGESLVFSKDEIEYLKSLWPSSRYGMEDLGELIGLYAYKKEGYLELAYEFEEYVVHFDEIKEKMQDYIEGEWKDGGYDSYVSTTVSDGVAEGLKAGCNIWDYGDKRDISILFGLEGDYYEVGSLLDAHWPAQAIEMPPKLDVEPSGKYVSFYPGIVCMSYEWEVAEYKSVYDWFLENMDGYEGFTHHQANAVLGETIMFSINEVDVMISLSNENVIEVKYMLNDDSLPSNSLG